MKNEEPTSERYLKKLAAHEERIRDAIKYSGDRFDVLLISLSTSGLVLSIGFVKNIVPNFTTVNTFCLKTSWALFVVSLLANLFSQITGYFSHQYELKKTIDLNRLERKKEPKYNYRSLDSSSKILNNSTRALNLISTLSLVLGIIFLVYFFDKNM